MTIYKSGVWKYIKEERYDDGGDCEAEQCLAFFNIFPDADLYIVIIPYEFFQLHFPDSSFQTDTLVSHTQSQPKSES